MMNVKRGVRAAGDGFEVLRRDEPELLVWTGEQSHVPGGPEPARNLSHQRHLQSISPLVDFENMLLLAFILLFC